MFYFAYGSNMELSHMRQRCPGALFLGPALLEDWKLAFRYKSTSFPGGGAADILPSKGDVVWGVLWRVPAEDFIRLDSYEDVPWGYKREEVRILFAGHRPEVITYTVSNKLREDLPPTRRYREIMLEGAKHLPQSYRMYLKNAFY